MLSRLIKPYVTKEDLDSIITEYELRNWNLIVIEKTKANNYYLEFEYGY